MANNQRPGLKAPPLTREPEVEDKTLPQNPDEVRAGPGDAGRSEKPEPLPESPQEKRRGRQGLWLFLGLVILAIILLALF